MVLSRKNSSDEAVLITISEAMGSAPREAGTQMVVTADGQHGTIGGGRLEFEAIIQARKLLADPTKKTLTQKYALGPLLEQCCGGSVVLELKKMNANAAHDAIKRPAAETQVYMFGAGHVGRAVVQALAPLAFNIVWIDSRADEFPDHIPASVTKVVSDDYVSIVQSANKGSMFLVITHSHQLDYEITAAVLARGDAFYCGLIGSATKRARFEKRLLDEAGIDQMQLASLTCPIGVPGIKGKEPEVIAASVAAQLLVVQSEMV